MSKQTAQSICAQAADLVERGEFAEADQLMKRLPGFLDQADAATLASVNDVLVQLYRQATEFRAARRQQLLELRQAKGAVASYRSC